MNYSDRFLGIIAGTKAPGNDVHVVLEALRTRGIIKEEMLPFGDDIQSIDEYYSFKGANKFQCMDKALEFGFETKHEYVFKGQTTKEDRILKMTECLRYSPLGISVSAWHSENGIYVDNGQPNNHWVMCYGYNQDGFKILDQYEPFLKTVSFSHNIEVCKRIHLEPSLYKNNLSFVQKMIDFIRTFLVTYREHLNK